MPYETCIEQQIYTVRACVWLQSKEKGFTLTHRVPSFWDDTKASQPARLAVNWVFPADWGPKMRKYPSILSTMSCLSTVSPIDFILWRFLFNFCCMGVMFTASSTAVSSLEDGSAKLVFPEGCVFWLASAGGEVSSISRSGWSPSRVIRSWYVFVTRGNVS